MFRRADACARLYCRPGSTERSRRREAKASHVASLRWLPVRRGAKKCVLAFPSPPNQVDRRVTGRRNLRAPCTAPAAVKSSKMPNKMLIDATHPEETRVVVVRGNRVEEFDFETANRKQLRGNIYLAKVTRVEPSLQAAFIEYGGNRHGFLAFSEIHPDYYQIPVADRQALIAEDERAQRAAEAESEVEAMTAASEHMAPPADSIEDLTPDAGLPAESAAQPVPAEHTEDA